MNTSVQSREELIEKFLSRSDKRKYLERAVDAVIEGRVKRQTFVPSGRVIHTVVGRNGDEFVDPEKPFCSCEHFFFRVMGGKEQPCYHLLAESIAAETQRFSDTEFHDEEFLSFLKLLSHDLLSRSGSREGDEAEPRP
jgi:predicted nucleic acid-binding Zn finger protein